MDATAFTPEIPLISELRAALEATPDADRLAERLDETRSELEEHRQRFQQTVAAEPEAARAAVAREVAICQQALEDYTAVLDSLSGYFQGFDRAFLESTLVNLPLAVSRLNLAFLAYREAALAERGPTSHSGLNHLFALASSGPEWREALAQQVELESVRLQTPVETGDEALDALLSRFHQAYAGHLEAAPLTPEAEAGPWLEGLVRLGADYARFDLITLERRFGWSPTPVPAVNLVVNTAWLLTQDRVDPAVPRYFLDLAQTQLEEAMASHLQLQASADTEDSDGPPGDAVTDALDRLLELIGACYEWLESPTAEALDELARPMVEAAQELHSHRESLSDPGSGDARVPCPICGLANPKGQTRCSACGSALERAGTGSFEVAEGQSPVASPGESGRVQKLLETAEGLLDGWAKAPELQALVRELSDSLEVAERKAPPEQPSGDERLDEGAARYRQGLACFRAGLDGLREFADDPDRERLETARAQVLEGAALLQAVQQQLGPLVAGS